MRYMPTLRSPVSGSLVTTHGSVMKRPPSKGQHFWIGSCKSVGNRGSAVEESCQLGAGGHGWARVGGGSNRVITSLQGPSFTSFGFAWRKSRAVPKSLMASLKLVGGLALINEPSSAATSAIEFEP